MEQDILQQIHPCNCEKPYIFISYSNKDSAVVWQDVLEFQRRGYNIWLDEKNVDKSKDSWQESALEAVRDFDCCLVVLYVSSHSICSQPCFDELSQTTSTEAIACHDGRPVKFIAIEVEKIQDILQFQSKTYNIIKKSNESKQIKTKKMLTLSAFIKTFFNSNNDKVRIHPKEDTTRKTDYFAEITDSFPKETLVSLAETPVLIKEELSEQKELPEEPQPTEIVEKHTAPTNSPEQTEPVVSPKEPERKYNNTTTITRFHPPAPLQPELVKKGSPASESDAEQPPISLIKKRNFPTKRTSIFEDATYELELAITTNIQHQLKEDGNLSITQLPEGIPPHAKEEKIFKKADFKKMLKSIPSSYCKDIKIPEEYTSISLYISGSVFSGSDVERITLPDTISQINSGEFQNCKALREILLPAWLKKIPFQAFLNCRSLKQIEIPGTVTHIISSAFRKCENLKHILLSKKINVIESSVFSGCKALKSIFLPESLYEIGAFCFMDCTALCAISLPHSLSKIGQYAFSGCSALKEIVIPENVTCISKKLFSNCTALETVLFKDGVKKIESSVFPFYTEHTLHVWIPNSVTEIAQDAFPNSEKIIIHCCKFSYAHQFAIGRQIKVSFIFPE